jgi:hypothetical protein
MRPNVIVTYPGASFKALSLSFSRFLSLSHTHKGGGWRLFKLWTKKKLKKSKNFANIARHYCRRASPTIVVK